MVFVNELQNWVGLTISSIPYLLENRVTPRLRGRPLGWFPVTLRFRCTWQAYLRKR
jgi:hypothetical protein